MCPSIPNNRLTSNFAIEIVVEKVETPTMTKSIELSLNAENN